MRPLGEVYFIEKSGSGEIKIGFTASAAHNRLRALQTASVSRLTLLGSFPGDVVAERALHRELSAFHVHGEWFSPAIRPIADMLIRTGGPWYLCRGAALVEAAWPKLFAAHDDAAIQPAYCERQTRLVRGLMKRMMAVNDRHGRPSTSFRKSFYRAIAQISDSNYCAARYVLAWEGINAPSAGKIPALPVSAG